MPHLLLLIGTLGTGSREFYPRILILAIHNSINQHAQGGQSYQPSKQSPPKHPSHTGAVTTTPGDTQTLIQGLTHPLITGRTQSQASSGRHITAAAPPPQRAHVQARGDHKRHTHNPNLSLSHTHGPSSLPRSHTHTPRPRRGCICTPRSGEPWFSLSPTHFGLNTLVFLPLSHTHTVSKVSASETRGFLAHIDTQTLQLLPLTHAHTIHTGLPHTRTNRHCHTISHAGHTNMLAVSHTHISPSLHDLSASPGAPALANLSHTRFEHSHQHAPAARSGRSQPSPASRTHTPRSSRPRHRSRSEPQPRRTRAGLWEM